MQIEAHNLTKKYDETTVLDSISFAVDRGEVLGFLGPNGAGKTTTMRILTGFLSPTEGEVKIAGLDVLEDSLKIRQKIGYLPENNPLYNDMQVHEYLGFVARAKGLENIHSEIRRVIQMCGLSGRVDQLVSELSKGFRQRVGLAQSLLGDPDIIIMDEPTSGLDPNQVVEIRNIIKDIGQNKTVILSTHILSEVEASCNRVLIIHRGKIVASGNIDDLRAQSQGRSQINIVVSKRHEPFEGAIKNTSDIEALRLVNANNPNEVHYQIEVGGQKDLRKDIFTMCVEHDVYLLGMDHRALSLEDVFRQLTKV